MPENVVSAEKLNERLVANPFNAWMGLRIVELTEEILFLISFKFAIFLSYDSSLIISG